MRKTEFIAVLDFGSQYNQLIARRIREFNIYCEVLPHTTTAKELKNRGAKGIILSGGPASVFDKKAPTCDKEILTSGIPVLGICYGMQLGCKLFNCAVKPSSLREYGRTKLNIIDETDLFYGIPENSIVWMSHGDSVKRFTKEFTILAETEDCPNAAVRHNSHKFWGVQFHPEVTHTEQGMKILRNFLKKICLCRGNWKIRDYVEQTIKNIRLEVGKNRVICGLSGGVDSSVAAVMMHKAIGDQLTCIFVDNGLLRQNEKEQVSQTFRNYYKINLKIANSGKNFLKLLKGVTHPEKKRKIIGHEFIEVFKKEAKKVKGAKYLVQGTLYPDVIESSSAFGGPTSVIKTHHNVGGLPKKLGFKLIEPLKFLFKDEVRRIAKELNMPPEIYMRHPFPGPGLAVRILGEITKERLHLLRKCDYIFIEEIKNANLYDKIWQAFAVLLPVKTVGVMGDARTYESVIALRAVNSHDGMTADWHRMPHSVLETISNRIVSEVRGVNRVVYDISTKPPSTIEWE
ncbi:MAG: glutamine-hydrolyzing GMP synthase [Planctomycetota bacterium]